MSWDIALGILTADFLRIVVGGIVVLASIVVLKIVSRFE